eukprot:231058-Karenia_brevis.AAC.1
MDENALADSHMKKEKKRQEDARAKQAENKHCHTYHKTPKHLRLLLPGAGSIQGCYLQESANYQRFQ